MTDERQSGDYPFDQERENQLLAQIEAERATKAGAPAGLFALMLAPLLLVALPLLLLWVLRSGTTSNTVASTAPDTTIQASSTQSESAITWLTSFEEALSQAQKTGKPIMADFYADWCGPCKMLDADTWPDASVAQEAQNFIAVKVNVDAPANLAAVQRYGIRPIPCIIWTDSNGTEKGRLEGAVGPQDMLSEMQKYR